jgi:hypothetical protein
MLVTTKRRYIKKHIIGGGGIFDTVANVFKRLVGSTAVKALASKLTSGAQTELGKKFIEAGKTVGKEVGLKAIDVGKDVAIAKAKALIDGLAPKVSSTAQALTPKSQEAIRQLTGLQPNLPVVTQKSKDALATLINMGSNEAPSININKLLAGAGVGKQKAISIQDLVKRLNAGAGLRLA